MKLTKSRLDKTINNINNNNNQTRKKYKKQLKVLNHTNTARHRKQFNLRNYTLKNVY